MPLPASKRPVVGWALYDWANSAFATTVMAGFFPLFFKKYWNADVDAALSTARLGAATSFASVLVVLTMPIMGAISDSARNKRVFLMAATIVGAVLTAALALVGKGDWFSAGLIYSLALVAFSASVMFYDALLPAVSDESNIDFVSGAGYALGYLGGGVLLVINAFMFLKPEVFGFSSDVPGEAKAMAIKASFVSVGVWWFLFALPSWFWIKERAPEAAQARIGWGRRIKDSFVQVGRTARKIFRDRNLFWFVIAYWLYIDGVFTVIKMAVDYGIAIGIGEGSLITALVIVQFVGFPAALFFGWLGQRWNVKYSIAVGLGVYFVATLFAVRMTSVGEFYILAGTIGLVQGCVQALSRSLFARLIPRDQEGEYYGFYNLVGKAASILGPAMIAIVTYLTGDNRLGICSLVLLFAVGGSILIFKVRGRGRIQ